MSENIEISLSAGKSFLLETAGKICDKNIVVTTEENLDTSDATATATDILNGATAYVNGEKVTGTIETVEVAIPQLTTYEPYTGAVVVSVSHNQAAGYIAEEDSWQDSRYLALKNDGLNISIVNAMDEPITTKTITDSNLVPDNIKSGVSIFGVTGSYEGSGSSADIEALGVLCDWQVFTDDSSLPFVVVYNYHPSYYLHCIIEYDQEHYSLVVEPNGGSNSWYASEEGIDQSWTNVKELTVMNIRWSANE